MVEIKNEKRRIFTIDHSLHYEETKEENEFLNIVKKSDFSIYYSNETDKEKVGIFKIENDSDFIKPFLTLLEGTQFLSITDTNSSRTITFTKNTDLSVSIAIHLLKGEKKGKIDIRNIESVGKKTNSDRFNAFFSELVNLENEYKDNKQYVKK